MLALAAPLFVSACSSSSSSDSENPGVHDTTPPTVVAQSPADGAIDVTRSGPYWVAFSEPMDEDVFPAAVSFTPGSVYYDLSWRGDTLVVTPGSLLQGGTIHSITIAGTVEDANGNALGDDFAISFTTTAAADVTPPTIASTVPAGDETGVLGTQTIEITFSEAMNHTETQEAVSSSPEPADGWGEWEGLTLKLYHSSFPQDSLITITIGVGASDLTGNHLAAPYVFSFRTRQDETRPYLASASPANGAVSVSTGLSQIVFTFSEAMDMNSFDFPYEYMDARVNQLITSEPTFSPDNTTITVTLAHALAPGCTYWVNFFNATDASGNPIDPNPTPYQFTAVGTATSFPVANADTWSFIRGDIDEVTMAIANYNQGTGTFDQTVENGDGQTQEITHFKKTSTLIQHLGRDEYRNGIYQFSMMWNAPLTYVELPVEDHLGDSWPLSATAVIDDSTTMTLIGSTSLEASAVDLVSEALRGTFKDCAVLHRDALFRSRTLAPYWRLWRIGGGRLLGSRVEAGRLGGHRDDRPRR
ncbi:MAG: Ig-like domain-containing protein [Candidatus Krumholzibacteria bacterium]|nr:Ig-like domain-containing protein [Candidatus Krumholzibacteria bacterium]